MRYIITTVWAVIFVEIIGFIGSKLTQMAFNPCESALIG
ncbi:MAG: YjzD family protein, partial [Lactobacillus iners]|nr:YjzD family protein [Lactobacillus iners]